MDEHNQLAENGIENANDVHRVAIRVPPFWPKEPALWFAQVEAQFALAKITRDETKFHYVIANLEAGHAAEVRDIIVAPPAEGKYERIKNELVSRSSISAEQRIRRLLEGEELGDRKPSQFLRHLRRLAENSVNDEVLRALWIDRLPVNTQAILATQDNATLDSAAALADKISEVIRPQVSAVAGAREDDSLKREVETLRARIEQLTSNGPDGEKPRRRARSRSRSRPRQAGMCWYHDRFRGKARKCVPPCNFAAGNDKGSR